MNTLVFLDGTIVSRDALAYAGKVQLRNVELDAASPCQGGGYWLRLRFANDAHCLLMFDEAWQALDYLTTNPRLHRPDSIRINPEKLFMRLVRDLPHTMKAFKRAGTKVYTTNANPYTCEIKP